jgi:hypothetical protein
MFGCKPLRAKENYIGEATLYENDRESHTITFLSAAVASLGVGIC